MRLLLPIFGAFALTACASVHRPEPKLTLVDYSHEFDELVAPLAGQPVESQWQAVEQRFDARLPGFYGHERFGDRADQVRKVRFERLSRWPQIRTEAVGVADGFAAMFDPAVRDFERAVGALPTDIPVVLVMSLGEFDGGTRELGGKPFLMFGADGIAQYHGSHRTRPFLQHELFHLYHSPRFGCEQTWCNLWQEGLATYASQILNPDADDAELGLVIPEPIRPKLDAHKAEAVCAVLARLDSSDLADYRPLFHGGVTPLSPNLPPRFGYLVGLWVAADLGKGKSLTEMANWQGPALRAKIESSLRSMASCA